MVGSVPGRLAAMMFLQYFGLGAMIVPLTRYLQTPPAAGGLGFAPTHVGYIYMTFAVGAIGAPMVVGLLADRWFAGEKVMATAHALMAALMGAAGWWCDTYDGTNADPADAVGPLFGLMLGYAVGTQITLTLTNVISFRNLPDGGDGVFWYVRLTGTFGWIVAGFVVGWGMNPISPQPLYVAATTSAVLAAFAFALPHTPPKGHGRPVREVIGLPAIKMFRDRSFVVFAGVLFLCNSMNQFYSLFVSPYLRDLGVELDLGAWGRVAPEVVMTLAQWCEIGCMAATPWLLRRLSLKQMMLLGLGGWVLRNALLYAANVPAVVAVALPMHGWSYAFYAMLGAYFVDREAPPHLRAGAQSLVTFLGSGPAVLLGNFLASNTVQLNRTAGITDWPAVWLVPLVGYVVAFAVFVTLFKEPPASEDKPERATDEHREHGSDKKKV
ncbi:MAG: MFS transporter [Planctomycetes bacterium]|nr:MFS transporter [Planctomycetota bacterium]